MNKLFRFALYDLSSFVSFTAPHQGADHDCMETAPSIGLVSLGRPYVCRYTWLAEVFPLLIYLCEGTVFRTACNQLRFSTSSLMHERTR